MGLVVLRPAILTLAVAAFLQSGTPQSAPAPSPPTFPLGLPLDLSVPMPPTPFLGNDGSRYIVYELHVANFSPRDLLLSRIEVLANQTAIATYAENDLNAVLSQPGTPPSIDRRSLGAGKRAVVFVWIKLDPAQPVPPVLRHRITVGDLQIEDEAVQVSKLGPVEIGAPLRGDGWLAANGPSRDSGHRRALIPTEGRARIAQRFAIDWVRRNADGRTFTGDVKDNKSYRAYGSEILAVADAVVAATKDGIPENIPGPTSRAVPITSETIGGNHVVLDLGNGRFAFYAHLQPGSLRVKVGDRVKRGQVIGLVGNSGNSTEPHLHFHVSNGVSPLGSEGLPYTLAGMTGMPLQNSRVSFDK
jgi:murein DD-endopeptidase MepM/ murein hydrolase activator NlpD